MTESFKRYIKLLDTTVFSLSISGDMMTIEFPKESKSIDSHIFFVNENQKDLIKSFFSDKKSQVTYREVLAIIDKDRDLSKFADVQMVGVFNEYPFKRRSVFIQPYFSVHQGEVFGQKVTPDDCIISEGLLTYTFDGKSTNFISEYLTEKGFTEDTHAPNWWVSGQEGREGWFYLVKIFFSDLFNKHSFTLATVYPDGKKYFMIHRFYVESIGDLDFLFNNQHDLRFHKPIKVESHTWHNIV